MPCSRLSLAPTSVVEMAKKLDSWQIDKVPKKMDSLRGLLETTGNQSRLVYIHCEAGMDRTGESLCVSLGVHWLSQLCYTHAQVKCLARTTCAS